MNRSNVWEDNYHDDVIKWKRFPRYWPFVCVGGAGVPPVTGGFPSQRASNVGFGVSFDISLNKQSSRRWFETPGRYGSSL